MGKNTWLSLPKKPLKYRENLILSSSLTEKEIKKYDNTKLFNDMVSLNQYITKKKEPVETSKKDTPFNFSLKFTEAK